MIRPWEQIHFFISYVQPMSSEQSAMDPEGGWFGRYGRHLPFDSPGCHVDLSRDDFSDEARCFYLLRRHQRM